MSKFAKTWCLMAMLGAFVSSIVLIVFNSGLTDPVMLQGVTLAEFIAIGLALIGGSYMNWGFGKRKVILEGRAYPYRQFTVEVMPRIPYVGIAAGYLLPLIVLVALVLMGLL